MSNNAYDAPIHRKNRAVFLSRQIEPEFYQNSESSSEPLRVTPYSASLNKPFFGVPRAWADPDQLDIASCHVSRAPLSMAPVRLYMAPARLRGVSLFSSPLSTILQSSPQSLTSPLCLTLNLLPYRPTSNQFSMML
jgi:hypothetical protein